MLTCHYLPVRVQSTSADLGELIKAVGARKNELDDHQAAVVREADR